MLFPNILFLLNKSGYSRKNKFSFDYTWAIEEDEDALQHASINQLQRSLRLTEVSGVRRERQQMHFFQVAHLSVEKNIYI